MSNPIIVMPPQPKSGRSLPPEKRRELLEQFQADLEAEKLPLPTVKRLCLLWMLLFVLLGVLHWRGWL